MYVCATRIAKAERLVNVVAIYLPGALRSLDSTSVGGKITPWGGLPELWIQLPWGAK